MPTRNVSLPAALDTFVDSAIKSGRYDNASEVVRAGLRLLEFEDKVNLEKLAVLKKAVEEGLASGNWKDGDTVFAQLEQRIKDRTEAKEGSLRCESTI